MGLEPDAIGEMTKNLLTPMKTDDRKQKTEHKELRNLFMDTTSRKDLMDAPNFKRKKNHGIFFTTQNSVW